MTSSDIKNSGNKHRQRIKYSTENIQFDSTSRYRKIQERTVDDTIF